MLKKLLRSVSVMLTLALVFSIITCAPFSATETDEQAVSVDTFGEPIDGAYTLEDGLSYRLSDDILLEGYLYVPSGVSVSVDLNGHTLSRDLEEVSSTGYLFLNEGTLTISDSGTSGKITGGKSTSGGAIYNAGTLTIEDGSITGNYASGDGGAIYSTGTLTISGGDISANTAKNSAGAIRVYGGTVTISDGTISCNTAENYHGGAIYASECTMDITGGMILNNRAKGEGGAILNGTNSTLNMTGGSVTNNASGNGGGIFVRSDSTLNMSGTPVVTGNTAATPNLYLSTANTKINVTGKFYTGAQIDVSGVVSSNNGDKRVVTNGFTACGNGAAHAPFFTFGGGANAVVEDNELKAETNLGTTVDSWAGLQDAINNASDGELISLSQNLTAGASDANIQIPSNNNVTLNLNGKTLDRNGSADSTSALEVYGTLTLIDAIGGGNITGGKSCGVFVGMNAEFNLRSGKISGNDTAYGAIYNTKSTTNIYGGEISGNNAENGGAVYNENTEGIVNIEAGVICGNTSTGNGGAIYSAGTLNISGGSIIGNSSSGDGGAIYTSGELTISGGDISGNTATNSAGAIRVDGGTATISGGTISNDTAENYHGGAIYSGGNMGGTLNISGGIITGNAAGQQGGAILNGTSSVLNLTGGTITGNTAGTGKGGGIHARSNGTINMSGSPVVRNNSVGNLYLLGTDKINVSGSFTEGADIGVSFDQFNRTLTSGMITSGNSDVSMFSVDEYDMDYLFMFSGGELYVKATVDVYVDSWQALQDEINSASDGVEKTIGLTQTLNANGNSAIRIPSGKKITINLRGFDLNRGLTSEGSAGHVIQMKGSSTLTVKNSSKTVGKITGGWSEHGGGINLESDSTCYIEGGSITGNHADYGGGIWNEGSLYVSGGSISSNIADTEGGGIYGKGTTFLTNCSVTNNTAKYGGGIYFDKKPDGQTLNNVTVTGNTATTRGGGIFLQTGTVQLTGGTVSNNTSKDCGGVYVTDNTTLNAEGTSINNNKSTSESGGAIVSKGTVTLTNCTLDGNNAYKRGGAIFSDKSTLNITGGSITDNTAQTETGGGICIYDGTLNLDGGSITGNTGMVGGSGIWVDEDADAVNIKGKVIVKDNVNSNLYLDGNKKLKVNGALTNGAQVCVSMKYVSGTFTTGYKENNPDTDPSRFFTPDKGFAVTADENGEAMVIESDWRLLQKQIDEIDDGAGSSFLILEKDWKAAKGDVSLVIPEGKTIILNLNGHKIDSKGFTGTVIRVQGTLIIRDTSDDKKGIITGGTASAIENYGTLTLESGNISGNSAGSKGGGIENVGTMTISGGKITENTSGGDGGGIYNTGTLTISGGEISNNTAKNSGGALRIIGGTVTVTGGTMTGNIATNYHGGAVYLSDAALNLYGGAITGNRAAMEGGGILYGSNSTLSVKNTPVVKENSAPTGKNILMRSGNKISIAGELSQDAILDIVSKGDPSQALTQYYSLTGSAKSNFPYDGGSVELRVGGDGELYLPEINADKTVDSWDALQAELDNSDNDGKTIAVTKDLNGSGKDRLLLVGSGRNVTVDLCGHTVDLKRDSEGDTKHVFEAKGGATLTIKDSFRSGVITGGWEDNGGGIYVNTDSTVNLQYVTVRGNKADEDGGGIYVKGTLNMTGGVVSGNSASDEGGGIYTDDEDSAVITLNGVEISGNTSKHGGGGLYLQLKDNGSSVNNCTITYNKSKTDGGGLFADVSYGKTLKISNTHIDFNTADDEGGGVNVNESVLEMEDCSVSGNTAKVGGGINIKWDADSEILGVINKIIEKQQFVFYADNTKINNNTTSSKGGGIYTAGSISLNNCEVNGNTAGGDGGGIYNDSKYSRSVLTDTTVDKNTSEGDNNKGGGIMIDDGSLKMVRGSVSDNDTGGDCGGIYINSKAWSNCYRNGVKGKKYPDIFVDEYDFISDGTAIKRNSSYKDGGGIYQYRGKALVKGGEISENQPRNSGAGMYITENTVMTVEGASFTDNKSGYSGSAIYLEDDGELNLYGATVTGNQSGDKGAVYADEDVHIKGKVIVKDNEGGDFYFCHNEEFKVDGALDTASEINIALEDKVGTFTENLPNHNPNDDPNEFFTAPADHSVRTDDDGEARLIASDWIYLQDEINAADNGGTVTLTKDYTADPIDETLVIPEGKTITLDLNGHTLDKNGSPQVIRVSKTSALTIVDGSEKQDGSITGGYGFKGGGVYVQGTLFFRGGNINDNKATLGGGIYNEGTTEISGGKITGNTSTLGGGVYNTGTLTITGGTIGSNTADVSGGGIRSTGTINLYGGRIAENTAVNEGGGITLAGTNSMLFTKDAPYVKDNIAPSCKNILLDTGTAVTLKGKLTDDAKLDVAVKDYKSAITSGFGTSGTSQSVFSYNENSTITLEQKADGELYFPAAFDSDILWVNNWIELQSAINNATTGQVIGLNTDLTPDGEMRIEVKNKTVTIELAGHTMDRGLSSKTDQGNVFKVHDNAKLTIKDTVQTGVIKGGYADGDGGGFYVLDGATLTIQGGSVQSNKASSDGAGIYVDDATLVMTGGSVAGNTSSDNGGGIYTTGDATFTLSDAVISGNTSKYGGGGMNIHLKDSSSAITDCTIAYNVSEKSDGAGISLDAANKTLTVTGTTISNNTSDDEGGGVYVDHGTFMMDGGSIDSNTAKDGGGVYITGGDYFTAKNGAVISNNQTTKYSGGGITCHGFLTINGAAVKNNFSSRFGGGIFYQNSGETITLTDALISGNLSVNEGGGVYIKQGNVNLVRGTVTLNTAPKGGGIYVTDNTKLTADGVTFSDNTTNLSESKQASDLSVYSHVDDEALKQLLNYSSDVDRNANGKISEDCSGAGLFNEGTSTLTACTFKDNIADFSGGGVFTDEKLTVTDSTFTGNKASEQYGGAICQLDGDVSVTGATVIQSNSSSRYGNGIFAAKDADSFKLKGNPVISDNVGGTDVYLSEGKKITLSGALTSGAKIGVVLDRKTGKFTEDFTEKNDDKKPEDFFFSNDGYIVYLTGGEAALKAPEEEEATFIPKEEQITDHSKLNSKNWMSGISGERTLNEINFAGTHDSAMKNAHWNITTSKLRKIGGIVTAVSLGVVAVGFFFAPLAVIGMIGLAGSFLFWGKFATFGADQATTQSLYINEQMEAGVRSFDLRLNNRYCKHWFSSSLTDDGKNLYLCHGKDANGGTFYAMDKDDNFLTLNDALDWAEEFLKDNPSETISISLAAETLDNDTYEPIVFQRAKKILKEYSQHINPSTGKPYIYWEDGNMEKQYTHYPKLKEIRGQILIQNDTEYFGGFSWDMNGTIDYRAPNTYLVNQPDERIKDIYSFYGTYGTPDLPTDADTHTDYINKVKMNTTDDSSKLLWMTNPRDMQDEVFAEFFGKGKFFDQHGKYVGLINTDNINETVSRYVWESNFFDGQEYCTVTVKSGLNDTELYPDKTYKLLKGTEITIPYSVYTPQNDEGYFQNWRANGTDYFYGDAYKVDEDVTFVGVWGDEIKTPLTIVWNDGDDVDNLRPDSLKLNVTNEDDDNAAEITVDKEDDWKAVITGRADHVIPDWSGITVTVDNPQGEDTAGYRYEVEGSEGFGYTVTLYHAATKTETVGGTVTWYDEDNKYGKRPESVTLHLYKNGLDTGETRIANADNDWSYSFGDLKVFQNFEKTEFTVIEDPIDGYSISSGDYDFTNVFDKSVFTTINGIIYWKDSSDASGKRPATVTLHLYANGEEIDSQTIEAGDDDLMLWDFDVIEYELAHPGAETVYTVTEEPIPGYEITVTAETDEDQDESTARIFSITNEYDTSNNYFRTHSISLSGDVAVNFYINMTSEEAENAKVNFSWFNKELNDVVPTYDEDQKLYRVSCPVAAAEMTYDVTASLTINGQEVETNRYSVFKYANAVLSDSEFKQSYTEKYGIEKYNKLTDLITAMLDYGAKAQLVFDRNTDTLANLGINFFTEDVTPDMFETESDAMDRGLEAYGLEYQYSSIVFLSGMSLRHFYTVTDQTKYDSVKSSLKFVDEAAGTEYAVIPVKRGDMIYFQKKNIPASQLDNQYSLVIGSSSYKYSVMDGIKAMMESDPDDNSYELCQATYRYNQKANDYFGD